jgi:CheY-like chemotaxis protein
VRKLLVVEDDEAQRKAIVALIGNGQVSTTAVATAQEALDILARENFDCAVLDLSLPDMSGLKLMQRLEKRGDLKRMPVVIYTGKDLTREEERELDALAKTVIIKDARSPERLVDETALFLHRVQSDMPEPTRDLLRAGAGSPDPALAKRRVLVVDDDVRNIFALTALLEQHEMVVENAENGQEALDKLGQRDDIDIVLMDVMMPGMDGYEANRRIRESPKHRRLPIIALTAKAMTGDRDKCIEAGASDYITKPVDQEQLLSLLRVWLYR